MKQTTLPRPTTALLLVDVEALLGLSADTLRKYVREGRLPRPRLCGKAVFWRRDELEEALSKAPAAPKWPGPAEGASKASSQEEVEAA